MTDDNKLLIEKLKSALPERELKNVLIIDDETPNLTSFKANLRRFANVFMASNKEEAMKAVSENNIDYVFCDYKMPLCNGDVILGEITKIYPQIKRTVLTGFYGSEAIEDFLEKSNTIDFLTKPYNIDDVLSRLSSS